MVISELSQPSTGGGMEIKECEYKNKPVIVIAKEGSEVSGLVKDCPATKEIIHYKDIENLRSELIEALKKY